MNSLLLLISLIPLVGINVWHSFLLFKRSNVERPLSISYHAVEANELLLTHRFVHTSSSFILIFFAFAFLIPNGHLVAAILLIAAAIFDVLEVFALHSGDAAEEMKINSHAVTAWAMALCYLSYATAIIYVVKLNPLFVVAVWLTPAFLIAIFKLRKFNGFWIAQHAYFCLLALVLIIAHLRLLASL